MEEAIEQIGIGRVQWTLLIICGLTFCSDAAEVTFLSFVTETLRCEWGLTSLQETYLTQAVFIGQILGAPVWGIIADKCGRRPSFMASSVMICSFGFATALCNSFERLVAVRAIVGFGVAGLPVGFDILAEALPASGRGSFLLYIEYFWTLGSIYVSLCAWGFLQRAGWEVFTILAALPTLIASVLGYFLLPESPLWLFGEGRSSEALQLINGWAKLNGCSKRFAALEPDPHGGHSSCAELCTRRNLRKNVLLMSIIWFAFGIAYYGIVSMLPRIFENEDNQPPPKDGASRCTIDFDFVDLAISASAEVVGVAAAICVIDRAGRTWSQFGFYGFGAMCIMALGFPDQVEKRVLTLTASLARIALMAASSATWVHTPELFPTQVRAQAHALLGVIAKVGAVLTQFLISDLVPQLQTAAIIGVTSLAAGCASLALPETLGMNLSGMDGTPQLRLPHVRTSFSEMIAPPVVERCLHDDDGGEAERRSTTGMGASVARTGS